LTGNTSEKQICVFCPGNEDQTPREILRMPPNSSQWQVRVVPNKFNALAIEPELCRMGMGVFIKENGVGAHEVIIDHPYSDHRHPADLSIREMVLDLSAAKLRMLDLAGDKRFKYPVFFKNCGHDAGASIPHPHWQLMVLPMVPRTVEDALESCRNYFDQTKCCLVCRIINDELNYKELIVFENDRFVVLSYRAPQFSYELMVASKFHHHRFEWLGDEELPLLASAILESLRKLRKATNDASLNIVLYTAPWFENDIRPTQGVTVERDFHWHFRILPRMSRLAGFEFGTGFFINQFSPESVAGILRTV
jgi:UDPglucose--hexose-1-phosphate uridylyltransferase